MIQATSLERFVTSPLDEAPVADEEPGEQWASADELLAELARQGVKVFLVAGKLRLRGPGALLTADLRRAVGRWQRELKTRLAGRRSWDAETYRLVSWFRRVQFVEDPETAGLILWARFVIEQGPLAPEARNGALQAVLRRLFNLGQWDTAEAFHQRSLALAGQGQYDEAIAALRQALELEPRDVDARYNLAAVYSRLGRWADMDRELAEVLRLDPHHAAAWLALQGEDQPAGGTHDE